MDKWIGMLFLTVILAFVAIGSVVAYQMFGSNPIPSDSYGNVFSNRTNSTIKVETAIAPVSISIEGYIVLMSVVFVILGAGLVVFKAVTSKGGYGNFR
jgi:hypothetical protein